MYIHRQTWIRNLRAACEGGTRMVASVPQQRHPSIVCFWWKPPFTGKRFGKGRVKEFIGSRSMPPLPHVAMNK